MSIRSTRGFTLIELLVAVVIIGILANIAIPMVRQLRIRAEAASAIADINVIRAAAFDYYAQHEALPRTAGWGQTPPDLVPSLPNGFVFSDTQLTFRWQRYGRRRAERTGLLAAISVRANDRDLLERIRNLYQSGAVGGNNRQVVLYIE